jgi:uncharacterized protein (TIGR02646 family)
MTSVHITAPVRRDMTEARPRYQAYRPELREDFGKACGYCSDSDRNQDAVVFHVDHFAPKDSFPQLSLTYSNLVYACRFCNRAKWNKWIGTDPQVSHNGTEGFVDPCSAEYDDHLERLESGEIVGKSDLGRYMVRKLKLDLLRHRLLWQSAQARRMRDQIEGMMDKLGAADAVTREKYELLKRFFELTKQIESYELEVAA